MPAPPSSGSAVVFLPREVLSGPLPSEAELLALLRRRGHCLPPFCTLHIYPARHGLLLFLLPRALSGAENSGFPACFS